MKATIKQAETNERNLKVIPSGYGHWEISCNYKGKKLSCITSNSKEVDNFNSDSGEKLNGENRIKKGYEALINEIIRKN